MPDYQKMYYALFNQITDIIDQLQHIQQYTEELYLQDSEKAEEDASPKTQSRWPPSSKE